MIRVVAISYRARWLIGIFLNEVITSDFQLYANPIVLSLIDILNQLNS